MERGKRKGFDILVGEGDGDNYDGDDDDDDGHDQQLW